MDVKVVDDSIKIWSKSQIFQVIKPIHLGWQLSVWLKTAGKEVDATRHATQVKLVDFLCCSSLHYKHIKHLHGLQLIVSPGPALHESLGAFQLITFPVTWLGGHGLWSHWTCWCCVMPDVMPDTMWHPCDIDCKICGIPLAEFVEGKRWRWCPSTYWEEAPWHLLVTWRDQEGRKQSPGHVARNLLTSFKYKQIKAHYAAH